eukprot:15361140-Ditylum_brightwellii.AAC.1
MQKRNGSRKGETETLNKYTSAVQIMAQIFNKTSFRLTHQDRAQKWRVDLGYDFEDFNPHFQISGKVPNGWEENLPFIMLMKKAVLYLV